MKLLRIFLVRQRSSHGEECGIRCGKRERVGIVEKEIIKENKGKVIKWGMGIKG